MPEPISYWEIGAGIPVVIAGLGYGLYKVIRRGNGKNENVATTREIDIRVRPIEDRCLGLEREYLHIREEIGQVNHGVTELRHEHGKGMEKILGLFGEVKSDVASNKARIDGLERRDARK